MPFSLVVRMPSYEAGGRSRGYIRRERSASWNATSRDTCEPCNCILTPYSSKQIWSWVVKKSVTDEIFRDQMASHTEAMESQFQRLFSSVLDMKTDISAISNSLQSSQCRFPRSLGYPWEASSGLAENVLLLYANERSYSPNAIPEFAQSKFFKSRFDLLKTY
jgi:hypothetical protein